MTPARTQKTLKFRRPVRRRRRYDSSGAKRAAFTLLEVLLATVILAGALTALSQLSSNGVNAALRTDQETAAAVLCQTRLDEILATSQPIAIGRPVAFPEHPEWSCTVQATSGPTMSLMLMTVIVNGTRSRNRDVSFRLCRLVSRRRLDADWTRRTAQ